MWTSWQKHAKTLLLARKFFWYAARTSQEIHSPVSNHTIKEMTHPNWVRRNEMEREKDIMRYVKKNALDKPMLPNTCVLRWVRKQTNKQGK